MYIETKYLGIALNWIKFVTVQWFVILLFMGVGWRVKYDYIYIQHKVIQKIRHLKETYVYNKKVDHPREKLVDKFFL